MDVLQQGRAVHRLGQQGVSPRVPRALQRAVAEIAGQQDALRFAVIPQPPQQPHAVQTRQHRIQQQHLRTVLLHRSQRLPPVADGCGDADIARAAQLPFQPSSVILVVVCYADGDLLTHRKLPLNKLFTVHNASKHTTNRYTVIKNNTFPRKMQP